MKDPAFLFYSSDFLTGVSDLTMVERGQYITLLCLHHQKGRLTPKTISVVIQDVSVDVLAKFETDEEGNLFNSRLEEEMERRAKFKKKQKINGAKGGRPKKTQTITQRKPKANPLEDEDENETETIVRTRKKKFEKPSIEMIQLQMQAKGLSPDDSFLEAESFFDYYESNGWKVGKNPMKSYAHSINNWIRNKEKFTNEKQSPKDRRSNLANILNQRGHINSHEE